jgi:hypothetical protein
LSVEWGDAGWWYAILEEVPGLCSLSCECLKCCLLKAPPNGKVEWRHKGIEETKVDYFEEMCKKEFDPRQTTKS